MDNIPAPIQTTDQPIQQPTSSSPNPIPQFIPESKPKMLFLKRLALFSGILFLALTYYTNFKMCQETGTFTSDFGTYSTSLPCTFLSQLSYPFLLLIRGGFMLLIYGALLWIPLLIPFAIFLHQSKDQKRYLLRIFLIISVIFFLFAIGEIVDQLFY